MRNIEEDIEKIKQLNNLLKFFKTHGWIPDLSREINTNGTIEAIEHMLTEREADKKRIKELEEENTEIKNTKMNEYLHKNLWLAKHLNELYIPKQKVKDKMEKLNKEIKSCDEIEAIFKIKQQQILQELLEDK